MSLAAIEASSSRAGGVIISTSSSGPGPTKPGASNPLMPPGSVEAQRGADPARDSPGDRGESVGVVLLERAARCAARDVNGTPYPTADHERGTELMRDVRGQQETSGGRAPLR